MLARAIGIPFALVTFFVVASIFSNYLGAGIPLLFGGVGAVMVWWQFKLLDERRVQALLNPPVQTWHTSMPVSFGIVKDAFDGSFVLRSGSGLAPWIIQKEDASRGIITALLSIQDLTGGGEARTIGLKAKLSPAGSNTAVDLQYQVFSPTDTRLVEEIIHHTNWRLKQEVQKHLVPGLPRIQASG